MTKQEIDRIKYQVCCSFCENDKCVKGTDECEAELWAKDQLNIKTEQKARTKNEYRQTNV